MKRLTIAFTGGGTGGHVFPGIAVYEELCRTHQVAVFWIGSRTGMEKKIVTAAGIPFTGISAGKLRRYFSFSNLFDLFRIAAGVISSFFILLKHRPLFLFSKGGYVSVPPVLASRLLKIPVITHESDFDPGLATKINSRFAKKILVSYPETAAYFPQALRCKIVHTGNPVREAILHGDAKLGKSIVSCQAERPLVFVLGGSLGSGKINSLIDSIKAALADKVFLVHQTGRLAHNTDVKNPSYHPQAFFYDELAHILAAANLVIARAGANTLWELAATGKPSILIPLPATASRGDQIRNANVFKQIGASVVIREEEASPQRLLETVLDLMDNKTQLSSMGEAARRIYISGARIHIVAELEPFIPKDPTGT